MPLSLTTQRNQQTLSDKWSTTAQNTEAASIHDNPFRRHHNYSNYPSQPLRKQNSFIDAVNLNKTLVTTRTGRAYISRGLSLGRSHDMPRSMCPKQDLKKHSAIKAQNYSGKNDQETLRKRNVTNHKQSDSGKGFLQSTRRLQAWSSTSSILKSLNKELAQLNGGVGKCQDVKVLKLRGDTADDLKLNKPKDDVALKSGNQGPSHTNRKPITTEVNKVNLSIVLSHDLNSTKEENDGVFSDPEFDDRDIEGTSSDSGKIVNSDPKSKYNKKTDITPNSLKITSSTRPTISAQQRRALYHNSRFTTNLTLNNNNNINPTLNSGTQVSPNVHVSPSLTVQKRSPLVRAMSAPVRSSDEMSKGPTSFLNSKRKSRRRKLNTRILSCDKGSCDVFSTKDLNFDSKSTINRKVLTRSKSVAPEVVTLVSLISSGGSDSEKEDSSLTPNNLHTGSPNRRAPCLRKAGKSVSFQENYPATFQFASKEYSHMLRRGSIATLAQRIKSNRPPTAPPGSIYHITPNVYHETPATIIQSSEEKPSNIESNTLSETITNKPLEEEYQFPEYVRSLKERECWKLFMKMSTKGVNITYDTISRGMLTPTEFRQLQKQREMVEANATKEAVDNGLIEETTKRSPTAIERLKESLLKN